MQISTIQYTRIIYSRVYIAVIDILVTKLESKNWPFPIIHEKASRIKHGTSSGKKFKQFTI